MLLKLINIIFLYMCLITSCGSEFCEDDCNLKYVFTLKNVSTFPCKIKFYSESPMASHDTIVYIFPNIRDTINLSSGGTYTDSFHSHIQTNGWCGCYYTMFDNCARIRIQYQDTIVRFRQLIPSQTIYGDTFPQKTFHYIHDTITFSEM